MNFDTWWEAQPTRFKAALFKDDAREIWRAATHVCADICDDLAADTEPDDLALDALCGAADAMRLMCLL